MIDKISHKGNLPVLLISRKKEKNSDKKEIWCLPKGKIENNETPEQAAIREVKEETGLKAEIKEKVGKINYWYYKEKRVRCSKTVHFYIMNFSGGEANNQSYEVEEVKWFGINKALANMAYKKEKEIVEKVKRELKR